MRRLTFSILKKHNVNKKAVFPDKGTQIGKEGLQVDSTE